MSRVDVIVPCHEYGHFLRECVESVLAQEAVQARVLVLDDASPDGTAEVAGELAARDERVLFRRHAVNRGHIATYNEGLAWASSEYMLLLDADDVLTPGALLRATRLMEVHPDVGLTYGRARITRDPGRETFEVPPDYPWRIAAGSELIEGFCSTGLNALFQPTVVVRTSLQKELGGYLPELPHTGDMEMWLRFAAHGSIGILDVDQAFYRVHAANMTSHYQGIADIRQRKACFEMFFSKHGHRLANCARLRELALRRIAESALRHAKRKFKSGQLDMCRELLAFSLSVCPALRAERPCQWLEKKLAHASSSRSILRRVIGYFRGVGR
jgi:glycosyltransferase involved in cell wall biosynthesis